MGPDWVHELVAGQVEALLAGEDKAGRQRLCIGQRLLTAWEACCVHTFCSNRAPVQETRAPVPSPLVAEVGGILSAAKETLLPGIRSECPL